MRFQAVLELREIMEIPSKSDDERKYLGKLRNLQRLCLAKECFLEVRETSKFILSASPPLKDYIVSPIMAGLATTYMRPFMAASGLGPLDEKVFMKLPDELLAMHGHLKEARNILYAHQDLNATKDKVSRDGGIIHRMEITFSDKENQVFSIHTGSVCLGAQYSKPIEELADFQISRINVMIKEMWPDLTGGKVYPVDKGLIVGKEFP